MELSEYTSFADAPKDESFILIQRFDPPEHQGVISKDEEHQAEIDAWDAEHRVAIASEVAGVQAPAGFTVDAQTWSYEEDGSIAVRHLMLLDQPTE